MTQLQQLHRCLDDIILADIEEEFISTLSILDAFQQPCQHDEEDTVGLSPRSAALTEDLLHCCFQFTDSQTSPPTSPFISHHQQHQSQNTLLATCHRCNITFGTALLLEGSPISSISASSAISDLLCPPCYIEVGFGTIAHGDTPKSNSPSAASKAINKRKNSFVANIEQASTKQSSPTVNFSNNQPNPKKSKEADLIELDVTCGGCHVVLAKATLFGENTSQSSVSHNRVLQSTCEECVESGILADAMDKTAVEIKCAVCKRHNWSGFKVSQTDMENNSYQHIDPNQWEVVCVECRIKYRFCTSCGTKRKFRSGRWRPISHFFPGRKTCTLSHARIGSSPIKFSLFMLSSAADINILSRLLIQCSYMYIDSWLSQMLIPKVMEYGAASITGDDMQNFVKNEWKLAGQYLLDNMHTKHICVAIGCRRKKTTSRAAKAPKEITFQWHKPKTINSIDDDGDFQPLPEKELLAASTLGIDFSQMDPVCFMAAQWIVEPQILYIIKCKCNDSANEPIANSGLAKLLRSILHDIQQQINSSNTTSQVSATDQTSTPSPVRHVCIFQKLPFAQNSNIPSFSDVTTSCERPDHMGSVLKKLGFVTDLEYFKLFPQVDQMLFKKNIPDEFESDSEARCFIVSSATLAGNL